MVRESIANRLAWRTGPPSDAGCREWIGATTRGYGVLRVDGKSVYAHRLAWEVANGRIPVGLHICHTCDNPKCVEPQHLFVGTNAENHQDMANKGRSTWGERNARSTLTASQVMEIRRLAQMGTKQVNVAERFGISQAAVSMIVRGERWGRL